METITINGVEYIKKEDADKGKIEVTDFTNSDVTFFQIGKIYLIRTVTMIYTGRIKAITKNELLLEEAAWIPESDRWAQSCKDETFKEIEPYYRDVILFKGAILDATEISKTQRVQK